MKSDFISVRAAASAIAEGKGRRRWIPFCVGGRTALSCWTRGEDGKLKPMEVEVEVAEADAGRVDEWMRALCEAPGPVPYIDFDHDEKGGAAAAWPELDINSGKYARWADMGGGVMGVEIFVELSAAGMEALEGKSWRYFSPEFLLDDKGRLAGLPSRGAVGGLVNNPAFRGMPALARDSCAEGKLEAQRLRRDPEGILNPNNKPKETHMEKMNILAALLAAGLLTQEQWDADDASGIPAKVEGGASPVPEPEKEEEMPPGVAARLAALETQLAAARASAATSAVEALVAAGKLAAKDEAGKKVWAAAYAKDPAGAAGLAASLAPAYAVPGALGVRGAETPESPQAREARVTARAAELEAGGMKFRPAYLQAEKELLKK